MYIWFLLDDCLVIQSFSVADTEGGGGAASASRPPPPPVQGPKTKKDQISSKICSRMRHLRFQNFPGEHSPDPSRGYKMMAAITHYSQLKM